MKGHQSPVNLWEVLCTSQDLHVTSVLSFPHTNKKGYFNPKVWWNASSALVPSPWWCVAVTLSIQGRFYALYEFKMADIYSKRGDNSSYLFRIHFYHNVRLQGLSERGRNVCHITSSKITFSDDHCLRVFLVNMMRVNNQCLEFPSMKHLSNGYHGAELNLLKANIK